MRSDFDLDRCACPRCKNEAHITIWIQGEQAGLCLKHWLEHCEETEEACMENWKKDGPNGRIEEKIARRK
jgi:hypothetical protein